MALAWIILILSGMLEAVWATALDATQGFRRLWPSVIFAVSVIASMAGLSYALHEIPVGTAYAVWVGIGAVLTTAWAFITGADRVTLARVLLLAGLIACVAGLKAVS
ncbi:quaternary ammonium compound-resistance protein SugE [Leucobacter exalbidus]|uniref:Quaternary ammonium compound-resistance protein SugE n=1 Tax=Leucobacter exalbidus TaxID=662960 RepID=A0A940PT59_9MICO|nr:multidrug efflux SMR transporter [Leucobacter exalbidus]MBP1324789.1 quaternary ammonium compound-resistance protein SugE [Leucobacter exalbidus]